MLRWLSTLDPSADPAWHRMALAAMADAAVSHRFVGRQDGLQELLLWVHLHPDEFRRWSAEARNPGYVVGAARKILTDAIRRERGDHRDRSGRRIYPQPAVPLSAITFDDVSPTEALDRQVGHRGERALVLDWPAPWRVKGRDGWETVTAHSARHRDLPLMNRAAEDARRRALRAMSKADRRLLYARHVGDVAMRELADWAGTSVSAIERRLQRLRKKLREISVQCRDSGFECPTTIEVIRKRPF